MPGIVLMENAGRAVAEAALQVLDGAEEGSGRILVVCGKGNNGGDGFVAARHLQNWGFLVSVWLSHPVEEVKGDARTNLEIVLKMKGLPVRIITPESSWEEFRASLPGAALIVDALLGTGLTRPVGPPMDAMVGAINESGRPVLSIDVPSGLDADTGEVLGCCVRAARTVTLALMKKGLLERRGPEMAGALSVADIGLPADLLARFKT